VPRRPPRDPASWRCAEEGETARDELLGLKPPKLDVKVVPRLTDEQCRALVTACTGREFRDRRDEAIVRFMLEAAAATRITVVAVASFWCGARFVWWCVVLGGLRVPVPGPVFPAWQR
jgi:hypothetical protein